MATLKVRVDKLRGELGVDATDTLAGDVKAVAAALAVPSTDVAGTVAACEAQAYGAAAASPAPTASPTASPPASELGIAADCDLGIVERKVKLEGRVPTDSGWAITFFLALVAFSACAITLGARAHPVYDLSADGDVKGVNSFYASDTAWQPTTNRRGVAATRFGCRAGQMRRGAATTSRRAGTSPRCARRW